VRLRYDRRPAERTPVGHPSRRKVRLGRARLAFDELRVDRLFVLRKLLEMLVEIEFLDRLLGLLNLVDCAAVGAFERLLARRKHQVRAAL
jgi:hypothetical protein